MSKVNADGYINIQGWMVSELNLKGNELLIYAIIYGFSQDGESRFTGSRQYLANWTNTTIKAVQNTLNSLVEKGLLDKIEKHINKIKFCEYKAIKVEFSPKEEKVPEGGKNYTGVGKKVPKGREKSSPNKLINNLEYKLITTTTKINYIYPADNPNKKISSSSFEKNIKEIKKYLMDHVKDIPTCKNIMFLVENKDLSLERIKTVAEYAKKHNKNNGYIYSALENNWDIPEKKHINPSPKAAKKRETLGERDLPKEQVNEAYNNDELVKLFGKFGAYCREIKFNPNTTDAEKTRIKKLQQEFNKITCVELAKEFIAKNDLKIS